MPSLNRIWKLEAVTKVSRCRYPVTDEPPHMFCGAPATPGRQPYCDEHRALCNSGPGKDWRALAGMIDTVEETVARSKGETPNTIGVDMELRGVV